MKFQTVTITSEDADIRLDRYFKRYHPEVSFGVIAKLVRKKDIKLNGKRADISTKLAEGDSLSYPKLQETALTTRDSIQHKDKDIELIKNSVIFMDENIIVLNKPSGLAVQGGSKIKISVDDLAEYLKYDYKDKPKLVHRLDKETSGLLVLARKTSIAADLSEVIKRKNFHKIYLALCLNTPKLASGKIDMPIEKTLDTKTNFEKVTTTAKGKNAVTYYKVVDKAASKYSLIEAEIITGRTHQIRVHLSSIGCPIMGDDKYGIRSEISSGIRDKLYLHAYKLEFELKGKKYKFAADLPNYFADALNDFGLILED
ncbi:MAG: ribosomal large subunit pseudouridine synthase [Candidatus Midichloriaceae bacterium]|jgi:23S rRNA pseudouridine955/2504/2580 synthase|nr:ribosomal large subunit pseudouridine synthase [Candidatus Midichloriaceae bacterium]